jgi:hypothetical protein
VTDALKNLLQAAAELGAVEEANGERWLHATCAGQHTALFCERDDPSDMILWRAVKAVQDAALAASERDDLFSPAPRADSSKLQGSPVAREADDSPPRSTDDADIAPR